MVPGDAGSTPVVETKEAASCRFVSGICDGDFPYRSKRNFPSAFCGRRDVSEDEGSGRPSDAKIEIVRDQVFPVRKGMDGF